MEITKEEYSARLDRFELQKRTVKRLWNVGEQTVKLLQLLVKIKQPHNILEIGASNGYSIFHLYSASEAFQAEIETIESDVERYNLACENLKGLERLTIHFGKAEYVVPTLKNSYDFVFLDANKSDYKNYLALLKTKLKVGALLVADNILSHEKTVAEYLNELSKDQSFTSITIPIEAGLEITLYEPKVES
ncbi:MAG: class I SAM-dependent methyltransferase [Candidatus Cloacimonadia bacterium]